MLVHVCASYKRSPVGFQPGSFIWQKNTLPYYNLSNCKENEILYQVFEQGFINGMKGKLPNTTKYVFLIKDVEYSYDNHEEFGRDVYGNLIFEFDNVKEYSLFVSGYQSTDSSLSSRMIADFIVPDRTNKQYALHIDAALFDKFVEKVHCNSQTESMTNDSFEVSTISANTRYDEQLNKLFGVVFEKEGYVYKYPPKKKHIMMILTNQPQEGSATLSNHSLIFRFKDFILRNTKLLIVIGVAIAVILLIILLVPRIAFAYGNELPSIEVKSQTS